MNPHHEYVVTAPVISHLYLIAVNTEEHQLHGKRGKINEPSTFVSLASTLPSRQSDLKFWTKVGDTFELTHWSKSCFAPILFSGSPRSRCTIEKFEMSCTEETSHVRNGRSRLQQTMRQ